MYPKIFSLEELLSPRIYIENSPTTHENTLPIWQFRGVNSNQQIIVNIPFTTIGGYQPIDQSAILHIYICNNDRQSDGTHLTLSYCNGGDLCMILETCFTTDGTPFNTVQSFLLPNGTITPVIESQTIPVRRYDVMDGDQYTLLFNYKVGTVTAQKFGVDQRVVSTTLRNDWILSLISRFYAHSSATTERVAGQLKEYFHQGLRHNIHGPAIIVDDKSLQGDSYYINGQKYSEQEFMALPKHSLADFPEINPGGDTHFYLM